MTGGSWSQQEKDKTIFKLSCVSLMGLKWRLHKTFMPNQLILDNLGTFHQRVLEWSFSHCWSVFKMLLILKQQQNKTKHTHTSLHFSLDSNSIHSTLILGFKSPAAVFITCLSPHHGYRLWCHPLALLADDQLSQVRLREAAQLVQCVVLWHGQAGDVRRQVGERDVDGGSVALLQTQHRTQDVRHALCHL